VTFREPRIPVYSNVTAAPFPSAAAIPGLLARQARAGPPADHMLSSGTLGCALLFCALCLHVQALRSTIF